jgi:hypothetical protein
MLVMAIATVALALASLTAGTSVSAQAAPGQAKKFKATRAFVVDKQSGDVRLPTQEEIDQIVQNLSTLGQRPDGSLPQSAAANGGVAMDLDGGFAGILLGRPNGDGTFETKCVFTLEEGAEFLGLVQDDAVR